MFEVQTEVEVEGLARVMLAMARNAAAEPGRKNRSVHVANPNEKRAVANLEAKGLVTVRRTKERCGGHQEWWYTLAKKGA